MPYNQLTSNFSCHSNSTSAGNVCGCLISRMKHWLSQIVVEWVQSGAEVIQQQKPVNLALLGLRMTSQKGELGLCTCMGTLSGHLGFAYHRVHIEWRYLNRTSTTSMEMKLAILKASWKQVQLWKVSVAIGDIRFNGKLNGEGQSGVGRAKFCGTWFIFHYENSIQMKGGCF